MHQQLGPVLKALIQTDSELSESLKAQIFKKFEAVPFDSSASNATRVKKTLVATGSNKEMQKSTSEIDIPKSDLVASLPSGCLKRMVSFVNLKTYFSLYDLN